MNAQRQAVSTEADVPTVHLERLDDGAIAVLTLDDPRRANAMSPQMGDSFTAHTRSLVDDPALRAVVIRGAGKDFSIGGHRDMLISLGDGTRDEKQLHDFMLAFYNRWLPILDIPVPVIVALQGDCIGVAPVFACAADITVADEKLNLQVTFASLGFYPGMALPGLLKRRIGPYNALRLCAANEALSSKEAERIGLIDKCLPAGAAFDYALQIARQIALSAPAVVRLLKKNLVLDKGQLAAELEANAAQQAKDFHTDEYRKRVANYLPNHYA